MATITLSLSSKIDKASKKSEILFRFVGGREHIFRCKSGLFVAPTRWNNKEGKVIIPRIATKEQVELLKLQSDLNSLSNSIVDAFVSVDKSSVNKNWLKSHIQMFHFPQSNLGEDSPSTHSFMDVFNEFLSKRKLSNVRKNNFRVVGRALQRFELFMISAVNKKFELTFDSINNDTLHSLDSFLRNEHELHQSPKYKLIYETFPEKRAPKPRGQNTINDIHTRIRTFFNWAIDNGYLIINPYRSFKVEECVYGSPIYLTNEERNQILMKDLSHRPQLSVQRDIFIFQCLIGCRVSDLFRMKKSNVINDAVDFIPRKTKDGRPITLHVPLNKTAKSILKRYESTEGDKLLPFISEQKYNAAIKQVFKIAGVTRIVTVVDPTTREEIKRPINEVASSHMARRTFIGNLYKEVKDPNLVGSLSGHKEGSKAFARYRDIDEDMKKQLVSLLD